MTLRRRSRWWRNRRISWCCSWVGRIGRTFLFWFNTQELLQFFHCGKVQWVYDKPGNELGFDRMVFEWCSTQSRSSGTLEISKSTIEWILSLKLSTKSATFSWCRILTSLKENLKLLNIEATSVNIFFLLFRFFFSHTIFFDWKR